MIRRRGRAGKRSGDGRAGFTLVELMVVVATVGAIASIAIPGFKRYVWRAQRHEAMVNLTGLYQSQVKHYSDYGRYADTFAELGFEIFGGRMLNPQTVQSQFYTYTLDAFPDADGAVDGNFQIVATGDRDPSDAMLDVLMIENDLTIVE